MTAYIHIQAIRYAFTIILNLSHRLVQHSETDVRVSESAIIKP